MIDEKYEVTRTCDVSFFQEAELSRDLFGFVDTKKELRKKPRNLDETSLVLVSLAAGNPTQASGIIEVGLKAWRFFTSGDCCWPQVGLPRDVPRDVHRTCTYQFSFKNGAP
jgi:hypothetical protein